MVGDKYGRTAFLFLLPSLTGLIIFSIIPIGYALMLSMTDWDGLHKIGIFHNLPHFIGIKNYVTILQSHEFWQVLGHTLYFIVLYLPLVLIASLLVGMLLNQPYKGVSVYRVLYYIPVLTSWIAGALIFKSILSPEYGGINDILGMFGIPGPDWLYSAKWAMPGIVLASVWKDMGFFGLIFLGGLQAIDPSFYEAAEMDGAGSWKKFTSITLPLISPMTFFITIIVLIFSFQLFPQIMVMTGGGPHGSTQVMVERIYNYAFKYYKMGYASAFSFLLFFVIFIFTWVQMRFQGKWVHNDG